MRTISDKTVARLEASRPAQIELELQAERSSSAVARLVVAGLASRLRLPVDRVSELQTAVDLVLRQPASSHAILLRMTPRHESLGVQLGPLATERVRVDALRLLSMLVEDVALRRTRRGTWIEMRCSPLAPMREGRCPP